PAAHRRVQVHRLEPGVGRHRRHAGRALADPAQPAPHPVVQRGRRRIGTVKPELAFFAKPLLLTGALTLGFVALHQGWLGAFTEEELLHELFLHHWGIAWPAFVAVGTVYTALGGPRQVLAFSSGYLLGGWQGALLSTLITGLGAWLTM